MLVYSAKTNKKNKKTDKAKNKGRVAARIWAVQALYQMELAGAPLEELIEEFITHRLTTPLVDTKLPPADAAYFELIVRGVVAQQKQIDASIMRVLHKDWALQKLDSTLRALLRASVYELLYQSDIPSNALVSEYTNMAHAFFDMAEVGMVNALLDRISKEKQSTL
ncbi:MAG: transcription antitermination factor NusB [Alphaproteobacteria bacterium]|nr:transcription antitermination factor NusB [Alphaproteobacteria bacterium]